MIAKNVNYALYTAQQIDQSIKDSFVKNFVGRMVFSNSLGPMPIWHLKIGTLQNCEWQEWIEAVTKLWVCGC